ncbi:hypothetical protein C8R47DRAFT_1017555 [Mycena vitilis]|nr:hypothetical protein C8R47DRAFT_1017555 [Mycena vitilis]
MVTTRKQEALQAERAEAAQAPDNLSKHPAPRHSNMKPTPDDSEDTEVDEETEDSEPPTKKVKIETPAEEVMRRDGENGRVPGTTERGHIYFFFRPRVETDEPTSIDDVKNLHMLLVPTPPKFGAAEDTPASGDTDDFKDMQVLEAGADAVPAAAELDTTGKHYRLVTLGKKKLPDPDAHHGGRKESFWATVTAVGDDLEVLEKGMGEKTYETKTRGTRHDPPARLAARGCYAIVNNEAPTRSKETTYLGYHLSHPAPSDFGPVQDALGIQQAEAFVLQVKNPQASGSLTTKHIVYPPSIMEGVFGKGTHGRDPTGLRFAPCSQPQMLDYTGVELLLIAVRGGESGLEESLGEGRGEALAEAGEKDEDLSADEIFRELWGGEEIPEALNGEWI